jgi:hypothetical protein
VSNKRRLRPGGQGRVSVRLDQLADAPVLLRTVPAEPGKDCSWCDCRVPRPVQVPGGPKVFAGHDQENCPGCGRVAEFVVQLDVPFLDLLVRIPVCSVHRGDAEADLARDYGVAR